MADLVGLKAGVGVLYSLINGSGGSAVLNNGNTTSTFGLPLFSSVTRNFYVDLGLGVGVTSDFRLDIDLILTQPFSDLKRAVSTEVALRYGVW